MIQRTSFQSFLCLHKKKSLKHKRIIVISGDVAGVDSLALICLTLTRP